MNKNKVAIEQLQQGIVIAVAKAIKEAPFDKTEIGQIKEYNSDINTYNITLNNKTYENISTINGLSFSINDTVKILVPQNNYNNMFIYGKII